MVTVATEREGRAMAALSAFSRSARIAWRAISRKTGQTASSRCILVMGIVTASAPCSVAAPMTRPSGVI
jgi:hypothetical protein